jgi:hypothetical protein
MKKIAIAGLIILGLATTGALAQQSGDRGNSHMRGMMGMMQGMEDQKSSGESNGSMMDMHNMMSVMMKMMEQCGAMMAKKTEAPKETPNK